MGREASGRGAPCNLPGNPCMFNIREWRRQGRVGSYIGGVSPHRVPTETVHRGEKEKKSSI